MSSWSAEIKKREAAFRRAERDAKKRQRELDRQLKEQAKLSEQQRARLEVDQYENTIEVLLSVHKESSSPVDWLALASALPPHSPLTTTSHAFTTTLNQSMDWIPPLPEGSASELATAQERDQQDQAAALAEYREEMEQWRRLRKLAAEVLAGDLAAYEAALGEFSALAEISSLGSSIILQFHSAQLVACALSVKGQNAIPRETKTLTAAGKLSVKTTTKARFHEIYQDYVCSCVLRVAREIFALLPIETVLITAAIEVEDTPRASCGRNPPVLSVALTRAEFARLHFTRLDPSDAVEDFLHRGDAKASRRSDEFIAITPLTPADLSSTSARTRDLQEILAEVRHLRSEIAQLTQPVEPEPAPLADSLEPIP